jgi:hypothetical protein
MTYHSICLFARWLPDLRSAVNAVYIRTTEERINRQVKLLQGSNTKIILSLHAVFEDLIMLQFLSYMISVKMQNIVNTYGKSVLRAVV